MYARYLSVIFIRNATSPCMVTIYMYPLRSENSSCVNPLYNLTELSDRATLPEKLVHHCIALFDMY